MQNQKQKNGEAAKTKQVGTEPPGGASKTQANGQTDSSTAGQGSSSGLLEKIMSQLFSRKVWQMYQVEMQNRKAE